MQKASKSVAMYVCTMNSSKGNELFAGIDEVGLLTSIRLHLNSIVLFFTLLILLATNWWHAGLLLVETSCYTYITYVPVHSMNLLSFSIACDTIYDFQLNTYSIQFACKHIIVPDAIEITFVVFFFFDLFQFYWIHDTLEFKFVNCLNLIKRVIFNLDNTMNNNETSAIDNDGINFT